MRVRHAARARRSGPSLVASIVLSLVGVLVVPLDLPILRRAAIGHTVLAAPAGTERQAGGGRRARTSRRAPTATWKLLIIPSIVVIVLVWGVVVSLRIWRRITARIEGLKKLAKRLGFRYQSQADQMPRHYRHLDLLTRGPDREVANSIRGNLGEVGVRVFDFAYGSLGGEINSHGPCRRRDMSVVLFDMPRSFPKLVVQPAGLADKLGALVGVSDVQVGHREFDAAYRVKARNEEFAREALNPDTVELLLQSEGMCVEVARRSVLFHAGTELTAEGVEWLLEFGVEFMRKVPKFEFEKLTGSGP